MRLASSNQGDYNISPLELLKDSQLDNPGDYTPRCVCWPIREGKSCAHRHLERPYFWGDLHAPPFCHEPLTTSPRKPTVRPAFLCSPRAAHSHPRQAVSTVLQPTHWWWEGKSQFTRANAENIPSRPHLPEEFLSLHKSLSTGASVQPRLPPNGENTPLRASFRVPLLSLWRKNQNKTGKVEKKKKLDTPPTHWFWRC